MSNLPHRCCIEFRSVTSWMLLILICFTLIGCADILEPIIYAKRGGVSPATEDSVVKPDINTNIRHELAGEKPVGQPTWHAFWRIRYAGLRDNILRGYPDYQRFIDYIHQQRAAVGLPLYDDNRQIK